MGKMLLAGVASLALYAAPASAAQIIVGAGVDTSPLATNNDFHTQLNAEGLFILRTNASLTLTAPANIRVDYFGSESGFKDTFKLGSLVYSETNKAWGELFIGNVGNVAAGPLLAQFTSNGHGMTHTPGSENFGIFLPRDTGAGPYQSNVIWIGYDDQINNADDNHDDFIIRLTVSAVPEPATWAMMIAGFGLVGATMRRRTPNVSYA